ncbi:hypothetical protein OROHE_021447 [Orobanche hederae]
MDHCRYGQSAFTTDNTGLHFHSTIPSLLSQLPLIYPHQTLNPNPSPPHTFHDNPTGGNGINLNHGTTIYAQSTTTIRWPRQETLALLEIRSRLDPCFKEATSSNHKAPLWDEISRIMNDEYGYQRNGRKCKEKFENLYKYYKKTKEGKVGKHDGKHYRFFRQLESLFGDHVRGINTNITINYPIKTQSNYSSEYGTSYNHNYKLKKKELVATIEESMESQFSKLMAKQDEFGNKILRTIERKERERVVFEEEWRKNEGARLDHECEAWASNLARVETRDKCLLDTLQNLIMVRNMGSLENSEHKDNWIENEICSLGGGGLIMNTKIIRD